MPLNQSLFIKDFQKGSSESANIGFGAMVGVETYSKKGVAQLTKDSTKVSGSVVVDLPIYATSLTESVIFMQGDTGHVYSSIDRGTTWVDISNPSGSSVGAGEGLMMYQDYLFAWRGVNIEYCVSPYGTANWTTWKTNNPPNFPLITGQHFPFLNPGDNILYFANGRFVGLIGQVGTTTFNPAGTLGTDYIYSTGPSVANGSATIFGLILPQWYNVNCISFLPQNFLALGLGYSGIGNNPQIADIILWNPKLGTYNSPLRLFSQAGTGSSGVNQLINRNNVLYAVTGGNHAIFSSNANNFTLVDDLSLHITGRFITAPDGTAGVGNTNGIQSTAPIFIGQNPSAITVLGNKLYSGTGTSISSLPTGYGNFPLGIWSEAFNEEGNSLQCEFTISTGTICSTNFHIGCLYPISQNQMLIGWQDGINFGIDRTEYQNFQNDDKVVWIESEMIEIGTPLDPTVITTIQENIVRNLLLGQTVSVYYRNGFDQAYTLLETFNSADGDINLNNSLKTTKNPMGPVKYLQLKLSMQTGGSNLAWTPELRNIIVSGK